MKQSKSSQGNTGVTDGHGRRSLGVAARLKVLHEVWEGIPQAPSPSPSSPSRQHP